LLPGGANQFPGGFLPPTEDQRLFTAHAKVGLRQANGNKTRAAELLGIHRRLLYEKLREYGLESN